MKIKLIVLTMICLFAGQILAQVDSSLETVAPTRGLIVPAANASVRNVDPPRLFAIMIGINEYSDPSLNLQYPVDDATDLGVALKKAAAKFLGEENVFMYPINSRVQPGAVGFTTPEKDGIKRALKEVGGKARTEDVVLIFFAGHGALLGEDEKEFKFLTAEATKENPIGFTTKELKEWLSYQGPHKMLPNKTILIIDACSSGQVNSDIIALPPPSSNYNTDDEEVVRQVIDLKDKSGMFILSASAPNQPAYELPQYNHGLLTYCLLSVLKNNSAILDDQRFLNVQKWFLESEQKLQEEVGSKGLKQDAKPFGTANIRIGIVDEEVRSTINLVNEKAIVYCDNIIESESADDLLDLKELLSKQFSELSKRGSGSSVFFTKTATKQANRLNILYKVQEDKVVASIRLRKGKEILLITTLTGLKSDLDRLVKEIVELVIKAAE